VTLDESTATNQSGRMPRSMAISATIDVDAAPREVFDYIARPVNHPELNGDGTVRVLRRGPDVLTSVGDRFNVSMKAGLPYRMTNTVVELEPGRTIAWHNWGRDIWRWEVQPLPGGGSRVTETYDMTHSVLTWLLERFGYPEAQRENLERSLDNLARRFARDE
jgi:uncharacterized protein YndB with AHSA1/START domain